MVIAIKYDIHGKLHLAEKGKLNNEEATENRCDFVKSVGSKVPPA